MTDAGVPGSTHPDLKKEKKRLRRAVLERRDGVSALDRDLAAAEVSGLVREIVHDRGARVAMAFWAFGSELPTGLLIDELLAEEVVVCLPLIAEGDLEARSYRPGDPVLETSFGAREPAEGAFIEPDQIDVVLVPAVAFDRLGYRVGYGGGFYDRFLTKVRDDTLLIGIGLAVQRVEEVPRGRLDLPVDLLVTEEGVENVGARRRST